MHSFWHSSRHGCGSPNIQGNITQTTLMDQSETGVIVDITRFRERSVWCPTEQSTQTVISLRQPEQSNYNSSICMKMCWLLLLKKCKSQSYNTPCKPASPISGTLQPHPPAPPKRCTSFMQWKIQGALQYCPSLLQDSISRSLVEKKPIPWVMRNCL